MDRQAAGVTFERALHDTPGRGWLTEAEARMLWNAAREPCVRSVLEVGTYFGRSASVLAAAIAGKPGARLVMVDPLDDGHHFSETEPHADAARASIRAAIERYGVDWQLVEKRDADFFAADSRKWDLIYLDGDHSYAATRASIEAAASRSTGSVFVHDVANTGGGADILRAIEDAGWRVAAQTGRLARITCER